MKSNMFKNTNEKFKNLFSNLRNKDTSFFIIALCVLLLSTTLIWRYTSNPDKSTDLAKDEIEEENLNTYMDPYEGYVEKVIDEYNTADNNQDGDNTKDEKEADDKSKLNGMKMPVKGEIIKDFVVDDLVYYESIGEWRVHYGIDIKPSDTLMVESAFNGKVVEISTSEVSGTQIVIDHGDNIKTIYNNLFSAKVKEGEKVEQGQIIGNLGIVESIESADGPHLHFEISVNGENVNPLDYMPKE